MRGPHQWWIVCCFALVALAADATAISADHLLVQDGDDAGAAVVTTMDDESDSLRPALDAISRRQRDLAGRPYGGLSRYRFEAVKRGGELDPEPLEFLSMAEDGQPEDIGYGYQRGSGGGGRAAGRGDALERILLQYLQGAREEGLGRDGGEGEVSAFRERGPIATTAFRERAEQQQEQEEQEDEEDEEDRKRFAALVKRFQDEEELERRRRMRMRGGEEDDEGYYDEDDVNRVDAYLELLENLWDKYKEGRRVGDEVARKRVEGGGPTFDYFNSPMGWMGGYDSFNRKRRRERQRVKSVPVQVAKEEEEGYRKRRNRDGETWFPLGRTWDEDGELIYGPRQRRFPVAKRAFKRSYPTTAEEGEKRKKKEVVKTDPKVEEALSHIFAKKNETANSTEKAKEKENEEKNKKKEGEKEVVQEGKEGGGEKKEVKKKSVDWSEYFGMDKRKKKSDGGEEKLDRWLLDQYYKTLAESTKGAEEQKKKKKQDDEMEGKLRKMEDAIVEEAIKDTGAHQGTPGGKKEAEEVKNRVLSRLAAAYSLEKMRKVIDDLKLKDEGKGERLSDGHPPQHHGGGQEAGGGEEEEEEDEGEDEGGDRKKKQGDDEGGMFMGPPLAEPMSEGYMGGGADEESNVVSPGECPALERLTTNCQGIADLAGDYQHLFLDLCNWHEVCNICGATSPINRGAVTSCDITFLREVEELCQGHDECRQSGRRMAVALRALRGRGHHYHQSKSASLCWQHPCLADYVARRRRR